MAELPSPEDCAALCRVVPGAPFTLADRAPDDRTLFPRKDVARRSWKQDAEAIDGLQDRLFAEGRRSLLVVLQGIDTAGKGGTIRRVFNDTGPRGVVVTPFGKPTAHERARDYLWRIHAAVPPRGFIGIWDRSHYEDVLVVKVRALAPADAIEQRYAQINDFERHLTENGVTILKFMLNLSREEQARRLQERVDNPDKHWKFNPADLNDRALWDEYMQAYQTALTRCSTSHAPWHVVPADSDSRRSAIIARIVRGTLESMNPRYPKADGWDPAEVTIT